MKPASNKKLGKELENALYMKAVGYNTDEETIEYAVDENGEEKVCKRKVIKKFISPDLQSVKILLDKLNEKMPSEFENLSDEDLLKEKKKLLEMLENI